MGRRVVITGLGVVSPVGNDVTTFWENLTHGVCGIDFIKNFPSDDLQVKVAGEVKNFDPAADGVPAATIRKADKFTLFAMATALAVSEGLVPPTIGLTQPDPECDLDIGGHNAVVALRKL